MADPKYLRMTIDVAVFPEGAALARKLVREGGEFGVGEAIARDLAREIKAGNIEIDDVRNVEDHS